MNRNWKKYGKKRTKTSIDRHRFSSPNFKERRNDPRGETAYKNSPKSSADLKNAKSFQNKTVNEQNRYFARQRRRNFYTKPSKEPPSVIASTSVSHHEDKNQLDIPGFYYDKEKKRYFKIAPNHCANTLTQDIIKRKEAETKRQEDIKSIFQEKKTTQRNPLEQRKISRNITSTIFSQTLGQLNSEQLYCNLLRSHVSSLKPVSTQPLTESLSGYSGGYNKLEHTHMMLVSEDFDELLCLWSLKETWVQRLQLVKLKEKKRSVTNNPISVHGEPHGKVIIQSLNKVTDICWAPLVNGSEERHVLYTTVCHTGYLNSLAMIRSLSSETEQEEPTFIDYNLGKRATWACAWNHQKQQFSVGSEKCALLLNVERRTMWEYYTNNSDPLSQVFSQQTGSCLHTGTRNGFVLTHDLRSRSTRPVSSLQHKSSVCSLNLLHNDVSLLASDFTGRICLWDLRNKKAITEYVGNYNQYTKIPVHVDEREKIVYSVGEDGYTRFWCLGQGSLLHTVPPPCLTSRDTIPCVQFSMRWGDRMGNCGLIMGLEDKLHFYGSLPFG